MGTRFLAMRIEGCWLLPILYCWSRQRGVHDWEGDKILILRHEGTRGSSGGEKAKAGDTEALDEMP
jgi:hypothetical protein